MKTQLKNNAGKTQTHGSADRIIRESVVASFLTPAGRAVPGFSARAGQRGGTCSSRPSESQMDVATLTAGLEQREPEARSQDFPLFADIAARRDFPLSMRALSLNYRIAMA